MAFRSSVPELTRPERSERWDRDRFHLEHDRERERSRDGYLDVRDRFERDDDHVYARGAREPPERRSRRYDEEDDVFIRERRNVVYHDDSRRRPSPPGSEVDRRVNIQRDRERFRSPSPPPRRRPGGPVRRQSSLDTYDRKPMRHYERDLSPPARSDYRVPPYVDIPLPRHKALPPPRRYAERDFYEEIHVSDPHRHGDDDFHLPERVHEKEIVRTRRRRSHSRSSRTTRRSRSSSTSSSSESGGTTITARSEYPKKGKTRIPARLVSKRALIEIGYPYVEEGNTIIVQKALGQQNIDDLLKLSDEYKKSELEVLAARSSAGDIFEERRAEIIEVAPPPPPQQTVFIAAPSPMPPPPPQQVAPAQVQFAEQAHVVREVSPARTYTTSTTSSYDTISSYDTTTSYDTATTVTPVIVDAYPPGGAMVVSRPPTAQEVVVANHRSRSRHSSRHGRHGSRDLVRAERLSTGELVLYEQEIEHVEPPTRGVRVERDRKGRMSISVPKYR